VEKEKGGFLFLLFIFLFFYFFELGDVLVTRSP